jgi:hypothetical protein
VLNHSYRLPWVRPLQQFLKNFSLMINLLMQN